MFKKCVYVSPGLSYDRFTNLWCNKGVQGQDAKIGFLCKQNHCKLCADTYFYYANVHFF